MSEKQSVLIIGGGTWGLSISLELSRAGYADIKVLDPFSIPSPLAAGNDVNKIVEKPGILPSVGDISEAFERSLTIAMDAWTHDPIYMPYFHPTGLILASSSPEALARLGPPEDYEKSPYFQRLETAEDFRKTMPEGVLTGDFSNWEGWYTSEGSGWCHASKTLTAVYLEAAKRGVKFITGHNGNVARLLYDGDRVKGAKAFNGAEHYADIVVLCAGSYSNEIFDFKDQLRPTAWTLAHIKMTPQEQEKYKNLPVLFNNELGFFMEPDVDRGELKICDEHPGYCNWLCDNDLPKHVIGGPVRKGKRSIPYGRHGIPKSSEQQIRKFLQATMPHLADRPLNFGRICWDADTPDRAFLIDRVPEYESSLIVAVGGSGNGVMNMPAIGKIVRSIIENNEPEIFKKVFRWRPETAISRDFSDTQGRFGAHNKVMDFQKVETWVDLPYTTPF